MKSIWKNEFTLEEILNNIYYVVDLFFHYQYVEKICLYLIAFFNIYSLFVGEQFIPYPILDIIYIKWIVSAYILLIPYIFNSEEYLFVKVCAVLEFAFVMFVIPVYVGVIIGVLIIYLFLADYKIKTCQQKKITKNAIILSCLESSLCAMIGCALIVSIKFLHAMF